MATLILLISAIVSAGPLLALPMAVLMDVVLAPATREGSYIQQCFISWTPDNVVARIVIVAAAYVLLKALADGLGCLRSMVNYRLKYNGTVRVRRELFRHYHRLGVPFHHRQSMGDAIFRLSNDTFGPFGIFDTILSTGQQCASLIVALVVMLSRSVPLTLFALSLTPFLLLANRYFGRHIYERANKSREMDSTLLSKIQRTLASMQLINAYNRQSHEELDFDASLNSSVRASMRLHWQENIYPLAIQSIHGVGYALVMGYGGYLVWQSQSGNGSMTCGDLLLFIACFFQVLGPLSEVIGFSARVKTSVAASQRVFSILDETPEVEDAPDARDLPLALRTVQFDNVSFKYAHGRKILRHVNEHIEPGELVAIVGSSGSGKSTLMNLLPRFYDPTHGSVRLGGVDLRRIKLSSVRQHILVVSQDCCIIAGTVAENIRVGNPEATDDQLRRIARKCGLTEFIERLPGKFEAVLAEGGANLSGGQRQRIGIARALLSKATVLIFDEPTSALDPEMEQRVMDALKDERTGKTMIIVTHRPEIAEQCDRTLHLIDGCLSGQKFSSDEVLITSEPASVSAR